MTWRPGEGRRRLGTCQGVGSALLRCCGAAGRCPRATDGDVGAGASLLPAAGGQRHPPGACRHPAWGGGRRAGPPGVGRRQPRRRSSSGGPAGRCPCPHSYSSPALHSGPCGASGGGGVAGGALSLLPGRLEGQRRRKVGRLRPRVPKPAPASFAVSFSRPWGAVAFLFFPVSDARCQPRAEAASPVVSPVVSPMLGPARWGGGPTSRLRGAAVRVFPGKRGERQQSGRAANPCPRRAGGGACGAGRVSGSPGSGGCPRLRDRAASPDSLKCEFFSVLKP